MGVHKVEITSRPNSTARDVEEPASEFFHLCPAGRHRRMLKRFGPRSITGEVQPGEFMLTEFYVMILVINRRVKTCLAVAIAMKIAKADISRTGHLDGPSKGLEGTDDTIAVEVGERNVTRRTDFNRQSESAFAALFLGLQGVKAPVCGVAHYEFVADVVLD